MLTSDPLHQPLAKEPDPSLRKRALTWIGSVLLSFGVVIVAVPFMQWQTKSLVPGSREDRREWFPFSHFPMYANLGDIWTLQLTDQNGRPLDSKRSLTGKCPAIRKLTNGRLGQVKKEHKVPRFSDLTLAHWSEAAGRTLTWVMKNHPPPAGSTEITGLQIWKLGYERRAGQLHVTRTKLAEKAAPGTPSTPDASSPPPPPPPPPPPAPAPAPASGTASPAH